MTGYRWNSAFFVLASSMVLATVAYSYNSPASAQEQMRTALLEEPVWTVHAAGMIRGAQVRFDLEAAGRAASLRIAYPPLKLLNNQWITLADSDSSDLVSAFKLTARTASLLDVFKGVDRYQLSFDVISVGAWTGEISFARGSMRPKAGWILFYPTKAGGDRVALDFSYDDIAKGQVASRTLGDVLAQLQEVADIHNGKPTKLSSLASGNPNTAAFEHDFDHDGLSDALEIFYGTDPGNPDSDDDTFLDGDEVQRGYNPAGSGLLNK